MTDKSILEISGPDSLSRKLRLDALEKRLKALLPGWNAYDLRLMFRRYQEDGTAAMPGDLKRLTSLLDRPPRNYRDFAKAAAAQWAKG